MSREAFEIREHLHGDRVVQVLFAELDEALAARYPAANIHGLGDRKAHAVLVAWSGGEPLGCGVLTPLEPGVCELKRMYVKTKARRQGVGRGILAALELRASACGCRLLRLECGTLQPEAVALYQSSGYRRIPCFGEYETDPYSVCYEKRPDRPRLEKE